MSIAEAFLTAEEFAQRQNVGPLSELVRGRVVPMNMPSPRHGEVCAKATYLLSAFVIPRGMGRVVSNDSGIITERNPDTVRGADVAYYSYDRVPRGRLPGGYLTVAPELALEALSPDDRWPRVLGKIGEYLEAGVLVVCLLDPEEETARLYRADRPEDTLNVNDELAFPEALPGFRVPVREFFE